MARVTLSRAPQNPLLGVIACFILALACLAGSIVTTAQLLPLVNKGRTAEGQVLGIEVGVKLSKRAILRFTTETGRTEVARDRFQMMLFRFSKGDAVTVLYDPSKPTNATIDLGLWIWQQPVVFFGGFLVLSVLGIFLPRTDNGGKNRTGKASL